MRLDALVCIAALTACAGCGRTGLALGPDPDGGPALGPGPEPLGPLLPEVCDEPPTELGARSEVTTIGSRFGARDGGFTYFDARRDRLVLLAGYNSALDRYENAVAVDLRSGSERLLEWRGARFDWSGASMRIGAYDEAGDRAFVIAGNLFDDVVTSVYEVKPEGDDAVRARSLRDWPSRRFPMAVAWDSGSRRLVVHGRFLRGEGELEGYEDETRTLDPDVRGASWEELARSGPPHAFGMIHAPGFGLLLVASYGAPSSIDYRTTIRVMRDGAAYWTEEWEDDLWNPLLLRALFWDATSCSVLAWDAGGDARVILLHDAGVEVRSLPWAEGGFYRRDGEGPFVAAYDRFEGRIYASAEDWDDRDVHRIFSIPVR